MSKNIIIVYLSLFAFLGLAMLFPTNTTSVKINYPDYFPKPNYNFNKNPLTQEGIDLGRKLFYDPILSKDSSISCSNCHLSYTAFTHVDHRLSHGVNDSIGNRNSPSLMNLAWHTSFMWDGAVNHLDVQALAPISHPAEMDEDLNNIIRKLKKTSYPSMFYQAFGNSKITGENLLKAISQFELTLISCNSKYDSVMAKTATFSLQEDNGYKLYKNKCSSCHTEPLFTNNQFENNGLEIDSVLNDLGRYRITKNPNDSLKFKIPTLRNIEFSFPYMHDGRYQTITEVLNHYTNNITPSNTLAKQLKNPIKLTSNEKVDLTAFLLTLTDKNFLFNKEHNFPYHLFFPKTKDK
ncbi:MAG: cytochrome-c peroxidase [Flavobacteriales bacterium]|nr:cytochrome-c peroxidase [Flavobacteriales bacterium]MCB9365212.1 cytochrome-c peroxidase [Flavobacteriales bacterium]